MEDKKIVTTEKELRMAIAHASLLACRQEENKDMKTEDIMRVTAYVSALVELHLTGEKVFDEEEFRETRRKFDAMEKDAGRIAIVLTIRREP